MKRYLQILLSIFIVTGAVYSLCKQYGHKNNRKDQDTLYQVSLLQSLMLGDFDGSQTLAELKKKGDFGLGTFQGVAGEMVVLDGTVYRCKEDGTVEVQADAMTTPFSNVTFFQSDLSWKQERKDSIEAFQNDVISRITDFGMSANSIYAVKATGHFDKVVARSIAQQSKPYPTLEQAMAKDQQVFEFNDIDGTLVGFYFPAYCSSFNTTGWHFHFISADRTRGGHLLDIVSGQDGLELEVDLTDRIEICLPYGSKEFEANDFSADLEESIRKVESNE